MFFYGKIEILNQQLLDKQITDGSVAKSQKGH